MEMSDIRRSILASSGPNSDRALIERLRGRQDAAAILRDLSGDRDPDVRDWVVGSVRQILGSESSETLQKLALDSDAGISDSALDEYLSLQLPLPKALVRRLRSKLSSSDYWEPVAAIWLIVRAGVDELRPAIRSVLERPAYPWHRNEAEVALDLIENGPSRVYEGLRNHDHDHMSTFIRAATALRTDDARRALEACVRLAADDDCTRLCQLALENFERNVRR